MATIEERAKKYVRKIWAGGSREWGTNKQWTSQDFIAGAKSEHAELTRWRDPKEELPTVTNQNEDYPVLIKDWKGKVWSGLYRAYNNTFWYDGITGRFHADVDGLQGWREIHE